MVQSEFVGFVTLDCKPLNFHSGTTKRSLDQLQNRSAFFRDL